jgi:hypothetical protein
MANDGRSKADRVRAALAELGEVGSEQIAEHIERRFGEKIPPAIVQVLRASLRERAVLERSKKAALERAEREKANEPDAQRKGD